MRYAIFSDVHANLEALQAVLKVFQTEKIDKFICLGDIVGYGADPGGCIEEIKNLKSVNLAGNHDRAVVGLFDKVFFNHFAVEAIEWTIDQLSDEEKQFLRKLPMIYADENICAVHAGLLTPERFLYLYSKPAAADTFKLMRLPICFVGHTHVPMFFQKNKMLDISGGSIESLKIEDDCNYIINVGSVGQPRDGNPQAAYALYDTKKRLVEIKRISYNIVKAQTKIRKARIAEFLAQRLGQGR